MRTSTKQGRNVLRILGYGTLLWASASMRSSADERDILVEGSSGPTPSSAEVDESGNMNVNGNLQVIIGNNDAFHIMNEGGVGHFGSQMQHFLYNANEVDGFSAAPGYNLIHQRGTFNQLSPLEDGDVIGVLRAIGSSDSDLWDPQNPGIRIGAGIAFTRRNRSGAIDSHMPTQMDFFIGANDELTPIRTPMSITPEGHVHFDDKFIVYNFNGVTTYHDIGSAVAALSEQDPGGGLPGGTLLLPAGDIYLSDDDTPLILPGYTNLVGQGSQNTTLIAQNLNDDVLQLGGNGITLQHLKVGHRSLGMGESREDILGDGVHALSEEFPYVSRVTLFDCYITDNRIGVRIPNTENFDERFNNEDPNERGFGPLYWVAIDCAFNNNTQWGFEANGLSSAYFVRNSFVGNGMLLVDDEMTTYPYGGMALYAGQGINFVLNDWSGSIGTGLKLEEGLLVNAQGEVIGLQGDMWKSVNLFFNGDIFEGNGFTDIDMIRSSRVIFSNCRIGFGGATPGGAATTFNPGVRISSDSRDITFSACPIVANFSHGVQIDGSQNITINGCQFTSNGYKYGIRNGQIVAAVYASGAWHNLTITNNRCYPTDEAGAQDFSQDIGLLIKADPEANPAAGGLIITSNNCIGNAVDGIVLDSTAWDIPDSTGKIVSLNLPAAVEDPNL